MMAASTDYCHQPLGDSRQQIRLLTILPAKDVESPIFTRLTSHAMPSSNASRSERLRAHLQLPAYMAVSYVCGSGQDLVKTHQIFVDGKRFPVTATVHAAFQVYRAYTTTPFRGWIDCICISQTDDAEKSQQILLMREIYFHALAVLIWLGRATPDSDRALKFINKLALHPLFTKASDAILELPKLEADEKLEGVRPSISEQIRRTTLRQGYAGIMNAALPALRGVNIALDVVNNRSRSDKLSQAAKATSQDDFQTPCPTTASIPSFQSAFQKSVQDGWQQGRQQAAMPEEASSYAKQAGH